MSDTPILCFTCKHFERYDDGECDGVQYWDDYCREHDEWDDYRRVCVDYGER